MAATEKLDKMLNKLDSPSYESLVYIGYFNPKSQSELETWVYKHPANITPLIDARKKLSENGWISPVQGFTGLNKIPQKSSPAPFIKYLENQSRNRASLKGSERLLTNKELKYIEMFIDSDFFRETFFNQWFFDNCGGFHRSIVTRDFKNERILVSSAIRYMSLMLQVVVDYSFFLQTDFYDYFKNIDDVMDNYSNFNEFLAEHFSHIQKSGLSNYITHDQRIKSIIEEFSESEQVKYCLDKVVFSGLFLIFPPALTDKLCAVLLTSDFFSMFYHFFHTMSDKDSKRFQDAKLSAWAGRK